MNNDVDEEINWLTSVAVIKNRKGKIEQLKIVSRFFPSNTSLDVDMMIMALRVDCVENSYNHHVKPKEQTILLTSQRIISTNLNLALKQLDFPFKFNLRKLPETCLFIGHYVNKMKLVE